MAFALSWWAALQWGLAVEGLVGGTAPVWMAGVAAGMLQVTACFVVRGDEWPLFMPYAIQAMLAVVDGFGHAGEFVVAAVLLGTGIALGGIARCCRWRREGGGFSTGGVGADFVRPVVMAAMGLMALAGGIRATDVIHRYLIQDARPPAPASPAAARPQGGHWQDADPPRFDKFGGIRQVWVTDSGTFDDVAVDRK